MITMTKMFWEISKRINIMKKEQPGFLVTDSRLICVLPKRAYRQQIKHRHLSLLPPETPLKMAEKEFLKYYNDKENGIISKLESKPTSGN